MRRSGSELSSPRNDSGEDVGLLALHAEDEREGFAIREGTVLPDLVQ